MVGRIYSFAENGLKNLSGKSKRNKRQSDMDLYYQYVEIINQIPLPDIEELWPNKSSFHQLRIDTIHNGKTHLSQEEKEHLHSDVDDVLNMLLRVEEKVRDKNPDFDPL